MEADFSWYRYVSDLNRFPPQVCSLAWPLSHIVAAFDPSIKEHNGSYLSNAALAQNEVAPHAQDPVSVIICSLFSPIDILRLLLKNYGQSVKS